MAVKERAVDRGDRRGHDLSGLVGREIRDARHGLGLSQREVGRAASVAQSKLSRIERGLEPMVSIVVLARVLAVLGRELTLKAYPTGHPLRDAAHLELLERFRMRVSPRLSWRAEVPVGIVGDKRAWDACVWVGGSVVGVEVETRPTDLQELERRLSLKKRDSGVAVVVLVLADTRWNRTLVRANRVRLSAAYPIPGATALAALAGGRLPAGDAFVLL